MVSIITPQKPQNINYLKNKKPQNQIIYGRNPVMEALNAGQTLERIYLKASITGEWEKELRTICRERDIPLKRVPLIKLDKLSRNKNHQGIVAIAAIIQYQKIEDIIPYLFEQGKTPLIVMLDNISDVRNIGAIARSAEVLGAHALLLCGKNIGMLNEDAIKTSAGALLKIPICREANTVKALEILHNYGITSLATTLSDAQPIHKVNLMNPICLILGSEGEGLHPSVMNNSSAKVSIPQEGETDSLNVSVAAGILMYEIMRQRRETS